MRGQSSQKPIKIDENLWLALDRWISSKEAKKKGYHSKAQFATEAIREKLDEFVNDNPRKEKHLETLDDFKLELEIMAGDQRLMALVLEGIAEKLGVTSGDVLKTTREMKERLSETKQSGIPRPIPNRTAFKAESDKLGKIDGVDKVEYKEIDFIKEAEKRINLSRKPLSTKS